MFLTSKEIREAILKPETTHGLIVDGEKVYLPLVSNYEDWQLDEIEGGAFDLRVGSLKKMYGITHIDLKHEDPNLIWSKYDIDIIPIIGTKSARKTSVLSPPISPLPIGENKKDGWILEPGNVYSVQTIESIAMPINWRAPLTPRTTDGRCGGSQLLCSHIAPNYNGLITMQFVINMRVILLYGAKIVAMPIIKMTNDEVDYYKNHWVGDKDYSYIPEESK
jgi:deoxycytidine triphosphate deaminase